MQPSTFSEFFLLAKQGHCLQHKGSCDVLLAAPRVLLLCTCASRRSKEVAASLHDEGQATLCWPVSRLRCEAHAVATRLQPTDCCVQSGGWLKRRVTAAEAQLKLPTYTTHLKAQSGRPFPPQPVDTLEQICRAAANCICHWCSSSRCQWLPVCISSMTSTFACTGTRSCAVGSGESAAVGAKQKG